MTTCLGVPWMNVTRGESLPQATTPVVVHRCHAVLDGEIASLRTAYDGGFLRFSRLLSLDDYADTLKNASYPSTSSAAKRVFNGSLLRSFAHAIRCSID